MRVAALAAAATMLVGGVACGAPASTDTASATATAAVSVVPVSPDSIRAVDFTAAPYAAELTQRAGGGDVTAERIRFVDLTGDRVEEAVVVVESGGTLGDLGVGVYRATSTGPSLVYFRKLAGRVDLRPPAIVIVEGAPGPNDAACCPSQLRESSIEWRGNAFEVTAERVVPNPG